MTRPPYAPTAYPAMWTMLLFLVMCLGSAALAQQPTAETGPDTPYGRLMPVAVAVVPDNQADPQVDVQGDPALIAAMESVQQARMRLLLLPPDTSAFEQAEIQLASCETNLERTFSSLAGINPADIEAMRVDGMKWIDILHMLNVDPGVFGANSHLAQQSRERAPMVATGSMEPTQADAVLHTARSLKGGLVKGHGVTVAGRSLQGQGLGANKLKAGTGGPDSNFANDQMLHDLGTRAGIGGDGEGNDKQGDDSGGGMNGRNGDGPSGGGKNGKSA